MTATQQLELDPAAAPAAELLAEVRSSRRAEQAEGARQLRLAVRWAAMHPAAGEHDAADGGETDLPLAGPGAPLVAEFCVAELAAALGTTTRAGRALLGDALELAHRLPATWNAVQRGEVEAWRARRVAAATRALPAEGAAYVDRRVAGCAQRIGVTQLDRLVEEALLRHDPEEAELRALDAREHRHVTIATGSVSAGGTVDLWARLDLVDALRLEQAIRAGASTLADEGDEDPLDVRRAKALGRLARAVPAGSPGADHRVTLYLHLSPADVEAGGLGRVGGTRTAAVLDTIASWCAGGPVTVKPVLDLAERVHVDSYEVPDRIAERVELRDATCVFPWCSHPALGADKDHVVPHARGGSTATDNLAPLCRSHHRLKTHGGWTYRADRPGAYTWTSPHGLRFQRDHRGTAPFDTC